MLVTISRRSAIHQSVAEVQLTCMELKTTSGLLFFKLSGNEYYEYKRHNFPKPEGGLLVD